MKKLVTLSFTLAFLLLASQNVNSQIQRTGKCKRVTKTERISSTLKTGKGDESLLKKVENPNEAFQIATSSGQFTPNKSIPLAIESADPVTLYGSILYSETITSSSSRGIYSFPATASTTFTKEKTGKKLQANGGGTYADGKYYMIYFVDSNLGIGYPYFYIYDTTEGWDQLESIKNPNLSFASTSMTYDAVTNNIYAISFNDDHRNASELWLSTMDMTNGSMYHISHIDPMTFIACSPDGQLYGVKSSDASLYKINKNTGELTLVGPTGVTPSYIQSGAFDPDSGKLYWSAFLSDKSSALYEVNITTGQASLISALPGNAEIAGLYIPKKAPLAGAPAAVSDFNLVNNGTSCDLTFTLPTKTVDDNALSGNLNVKVMCNEKVILDTDEKFAGDAVSIPGIAISQGSYYVNVVVSNAVGASAKVGKSIWAGNDIPGTIENLRFTTNGDSKATLYWHLSDVGLRGGKLDMSGIKYTVTVNKMKMNERTPVIESSSVAIPACTDSTCVLDLPGNPTMYTFSVNAYNELGAGDAATSDVHSFFTAYNTPYKEEFETEETSYRYIIVDHNNDENTWEYDRDDEAMRARYSNDIVSDDYLISPSINLEAGKTYKIGFNHRVIDEEFVEVLDVAWGKDLDTTKYQVLMPPTEFTNVENEFHSYFVVPEESGKYHISFHSTSPMGAYYHFIDSVTVEESASVSSPNMVTELKATAAAEGALKATLNFNAPSKTINDAPLKELTGIKIYRKGTAEPIKEITDAQIGAAVSYEDTAAKLGVNTYYVTPYNTSGVGLTDSISLYVGTGTPLKVNNLVLTQVGDDANITWEAPSGAVDDNYLNPADLTYSIVRNDRTIIAKDITDLHVTDNTIDVTGGQKMVYYQVVAKSIAGYGAAANSNFNIFGKSYPIPMKESFANSTLTVKPWTSDQISGDVTWGLRSSGEYPTAAPQDNDNGLLTFTSDEGEGEARIISPKLDFTQCKSPRITFWMYHYKRSDSIQVEVSINGGKFIPVGPAFVNLQESEAKEWVKHIVPLDTCKGKDNVMIALHGYSDNGYNVHIDNVVVEDYLDHNLSIAMKAAGHGKVNTTKNFMVEVKNNGALTSGDYDVELYRNNELVATEKGTALQSDSIAKYKIQMKFTPKDAGTINVFYAKVQYAPEQAPLDNVSDSITIDVVNPGGNRPKDLNAKAVNGKVVLDWTVPDYPQPRALTDNVEEYNAFAIDSIGDWKMVDMDGGDPYFLAIDNKALNFEHDSDPRSFQVFNAMLANALADPNFEPHSGSQYFVAIASKKVQNDDWMISPAVEPSTSVSMYVKSLNKDYIEKFRMMYSSTDTAIASFKPLVTDTIIAPNAWTKEEFTLPADAKYFAINYVSNDAFALFIDDISYTRVPEEMEFLGYNVYRNDEKVNAETVSTCTYEEAMRQPTDVYNVTALYDIGESAYSNNATIGSGVNGNKVYGTMAYGINQAIVVNGARNAKVAVYTVSGVQLYEGNGDDTMTIPATSGIYMVTIDNVTYKVIVK